MVKSKEAMTIKTPKANMIMTDKVKLARWEEIWEDEKRKADLEERRIQLEEKKAMVELITQ
jgi:hypothetical protein